MDQMLMKLDGESDDSSQERRSKYRMDKKLLMRQKVK